MRFLNFGLLSTVTIGFKIFAKYLSFHNYFTIQPLKCMEHKEKDPETVGILFSNMQKRLSRYIHFAQTAGSEKCREFPCKV